MLVQKKKELSLFGHYKLLNGKERLLVRKFLQISRSLQCWIGILRKSGLMIYGFRLFKIQKRVELEKVEGFWTRKIVRWRNMVFVFPMK